MAPTLQASEPAMDESSSCHYGRMIPCPKFAVYPLTGRTIVRNFPRFETLRQGNVVQIKMARRRNFYPPSPQISELILVVQPDFV